MKKSLIAALAALTLAVTLTACAVPGGARHDDSAKPAPSLAEPPAEEKPTPPPALDLLAFGEAMEWQDGVQMSVSEPVPFTATEWAAGVVEGQAQIAFTIVITNNSDEVLEPSVYSRLSSGGQEASTIFDTGNPLGDVSMPPSTAVLPGQTVQWIEAYSVADPATLTYQTAPSFSYEDAIFTNIAP